MSDFFARRDLKDATAYSSAGAWFNFQFESPQQLIFNDSGTPVLISFDGQNDHGRLQGTGPSKVIEWNDHIRKQLWVRREAGSGGAPLIVEVYASTR